MGCEEADKGEEEDEVVEGSGGEEVRGCEDE